jgi:hypothetical protein
MKNNCLHKLLFVCFLAVFFVPKNTYATIKYDTKKSIVKDSTGFEYRLSEKEEEDVLETIQKLRSKNFSTILLYVVSIITFGITGLIAIAYSIRTLLEVQKLRTTLKNYPDDDYLAQKLQSVVTNNIVSLCMGAILAALLIASFGSGFAAVVGTAGISFGVLFGGSLAAFLFIILDAAVFRTNFF